MPSAGDWISKYELVRILGSGGFGRVWLARASDSGLEVAVKILHPAFLRQPAGRGPSVADRFLAEARTLLRLAHPGLVRILDVIDDRSQEILAYVMERLAGRDLRVLQSQLDTGPLLEAFAETADILGFLHANGVIHRDVKASNVFLCPRPDGFPAVKLLDFGIAKDVHDKAVMLSTATGQFVGTLQAMAPECFSRVETSGAVDQWGLGVAMYHALCGRLPFEGGAAAIIAKVTSGEVPELVPLSRFDPDVARAMGPVVRRCLALEPRSRFPDAAALADAIREANSALPTRAFPRSLFELQFEQTVADAPDAGPSELKAAVRIALASAPAATVEEKAPPPGALTAGTEFAPPQESRSLETLQEAPAATQAVPTPAASLPTAIGPLGAPNAAGRWSTVGEGADPSIPTALPGPLEIDAGDLRATVLLARNPAPPPPVRPPADSDGASADPTVPAPSPRRTPGGRAANAPTMPLRPPPPVPASPAPAPAAGNRPAALPPNRSREPWSPPPALVILTVAAAVIACLWLGLR